MENREVFDVVFLFDIADDHGVVEVGNIAVFLGEVVIDIRAGEAAVEKVLVEKAAGIGGGFWVVKLLVG